MRPSRSGGSVPFGQTSNVISPVLTFTGPSTLSWTYAGTVPHFWKVYYSTDAGVAWTLYQTETGGTTTEDTGGNPAAWRVIGTALDGTPLTPYSNVVNT